MRDFKYQSLWILSLKCPIVWEMFKKVVSVYTQHKQPLHDVFSKQKRAELFHII